METFPHSGQLLASVHPCKHASVMKKFIDRMDAGRKRSDSPGLGEEERVGGSGNDKEKEKEKKKKGWGLGGVVRKVTGGTGSGSVATGSNMGSPSIPGQGKEKTEDLGGVQVDFYMVIVSTLGNGSAARVDSRAIRQFLKFIASIVPTIEVDSTTAF
jgi:ubiquitin-like-conjugating enzyme ATG3